MKARILVTGFEPFGGGTVNPSERMVRRIAADTLPGAVVSTRVLPVAYRTAFAPIASALDSERFTAALLLGLAGNRASLDFERFGVNWRGSAGPDNEGVLVEGEPVDPAGPAAYFATLPILDLVDACRATGVPVQVSSHAGTFLCNQVHYQTLRHCDRHDLATKAGFLHLPPLPEQVAAGAPAVAEDAMYAAVRAALEVLARG